ncbi:hypothetical protein [Parvularcula lutaonensis]|uniref:Uncharacterized protein n=1 Tax=Parvularcula lutaonensis TaxID=491923 RepID=A0ABV7MCN1_9PROT|nr:hypothetical protein [Parvularcula lutaonensis]GGY39675.1 hypothetical protein GCM10007148_05000 [Parvularcula lutaonensis]
MIFFEAPPPVLTAEALQTELQLRSFRSSLGQRLKASCADTPIDFFPANTIRLGADTLVIDEPDWYRSFKVADEQEQLVTMTDQSKVGSYNTQKTLRLVWNEDRSGYVAVDEQEPEFWIEKPDYCDAG